MSPCTSTCPSLWIQSSVQCPSPDCWTGSTASEVSVSPLVGPPCSVFSNGFLWASFPSAMICHSEENILWIGIYSHSCTSIMWTQLNESWWKVMRFSPVINWVEKRNTHTQKDSMEHRTTLWYTESSMSDTELIINSGQCTFKVSAVNYCGRIASLLFLNIFQLKFHSNWICSNVHFNWYN